jgi:hypothetical protein
MYEGQNRSSQEKPRFKFSINLKLSGIKMYPLGI